MNIQQFNQLISTTEQPITEEETKQLENLVTTFPYCQTGHLLLSKASKEQGSMLSEVKIKTAAAYSVNRRHLKCFLLEKVQPLKQIEESESVEIAPVLESEIEVVEEDVVALPEGNESEEKIAENGDKVEETDLQVELHENPTIEEPKELSIAEEIHKSLEELRKLKEESKEDHLENKEESVEVSIENNDVASPHEDLIKEESAVETSSIEEDVSPVDLVKDKKLKNEELPKKELKKKDPEEIKGKLKALSKKVKEEGVKKARTPKKLGEVFHHQPEEDLFDSKLGESGGDKENSEADLILKYLESIEKKKSIRASRKSQLNIIDNFIKNEPQVSRVTPTKSSSSEPQEDFSKKSVVNNSKFVSENMAKIYAKQGNISKAIKIYKELMLKKPEKKSYFAAQIEQLKKEQ